VLGSVLGLGVDTGWEVVSRPNKNVTFGFRSGGILFHGSPK